MPTSYTTVVQCCNDAVVAAISCKRAKAKPQKGSNKKTLDSADLELSVPEADDASSLCGLNHPLRRQYMQCCRGINVILVRLQMTATK
jgi:hypothetical protein